ncbi:uncharacterized protein K444DRAFT_608527 [Hyaloscypha bicolor E]|uniref:ABM domain-containing protein n=1 Tax=Hyaloscypha bicolor E TaxID=1095630 RepID=A0A2J6TPA2_9HELO|nr:uncharacterized protein K444DRAFT_608527 [Hyaloscypha bicolor E]PMD64844.1 hypothetical protein K444DRAFT_608527 [Hyaloscypha bicolor E]
MPVTERLILPVQSGADWKEPLKFLLQTLKKQEGNIRTRWGPHSENVDNLELLIGWESEAAQQTFQNSSDFGTVMSQLKPILREEPTVYFVQFVPYAPKEVIDASIVQVITVPASQESAIKSTIESYKSVSGCTGASSGLSLAEVKGKGAKVCVAVVGWESLEHSQTNATKVDVGSDVEVHHVNFRYPVKGFRGL